MNKKSILLVILVFVVFPILIQICFGKSDPTGISGIAIIQYFAITPAFSIVLGIIFGKQKKRLLFVLITMIVCSVIVCYKILKVTYLLTIIPTIFMIVGYIIGIVITMKTKGKEEICNG